MNNIRNAYNRNSIFDIHIYVLIIFIRNEGGFSGGTCTMIQRVDSTGPVPSQEAKEGIAADCRVDENELQQFCQENQWKKPVQRRA
jgi:hypothetical protein